jgi:hypothetical protein
MYSKIINNIPNHECFYQNFSFSPISRVILVDEPYGLRSIVTTWIRTRFCSYDLIVHNCNTWLGISACDVSIKGEVKSFFRRLILRGTRKVIVAAPALRDYFKSVEQNKNVIYYPFDPCDMSDFVLKLKSSILIHPGGVNDLKRYDRLKLLLKEELFDEVIFLGKSNSDTVDKYFGDIIESPGLNTKLTFFYDYISDAEFHNYMINASALFVDFYSPIRTKEGYFERFGVTKESGAYWLAIKYRLPIYSPLLRPDLSQIEILPLN